MPKYPYNPETGQTDLIAAASGWSLTDLPETPAKSYTSCIESGVDIPTVSRWLGHRDGGALAMRVYPPCRLTSAPALTSARTIAK